MNSTINKILDSATVIPVMVIDHLVDAIPLANALVNGGLTVLEITLRTPVALQAIKQIKQAIPNATVGSGTVIDLESFDASINAGVDFMVSPGSTQSLIDASKANNVALLPGAATPSEVMNLISQGINTLKFFPAEAAGGVKMLKSIGGPLPQARFCPTGGINLNNAKDYLALNNVACVGGTWMLDKRLIAEKKWSEITALAKQASEL